MWLRLLNANPPRISPLILVKAKLVESKLLITKQVGGTWNLKKLKDHNLM